MKEGKKGVGKGEKMRKEGKKGKINWGGQGEKNKERKRGKKKKYKGKRAQKRKRREEQTQDSPSDVPVSPPCAPTGTTLAQGEVCTKNKSRESKKNKKKAQNPPGLSLSRDLP